MNLVIKKIKENKDLILTLLFFAVVFIIIVLNRPIQQTDELIIFNDIQKMCNGYTIYKDFNVLQTPLFFYIGLLFCKIFGCTYVTVRLYGVCIYIFLFYNIFKLLKNLGVSSKKIFIYLSLITWFLKDEVTALSSANYNMLAISLSLMGIRYFILCKEKNTRYFILQGILFSLIFLCKQTIGVYSAVGFVICYLWFDKSKKIIDKFFDFVNVALGAVGTLLLYALYLYKIDSIYNFINYAILGIVDFKQNTTVESYVIIYALVNIIPHIVLWVKHKLNDNNKILFINSVIMLFISYPILCEFHSRMALIFSAVSLFYLIDDEIKNELIEEIGWAICLVVLSSISIINGFKFAYNSISIEGTPYQNVVYNEYMDLKISNIVDYIKSSEQRIVFISLEACTYNNILGGNNGILDYPAKGNMGYDGFNTLIKEIKKLDDNTLVMITKYRYAQEYEEMYDYIRENYELKDTILGNYEVYEKK